MKHFILTIALLLSFFSVANAEIKTQEVTYQQGNDTFKGFLAYDDAIKDPRPGIVVYPEWWGLTEHPKQRAVELAKLGYIAFAADMYGNGMTTDDPKQAGEWDKSVMDNIDLLRARAGAALDQLKNNPHVDPKKLAAIGFCFGGTVAALEQARGGADLAAIVGFHCGLDAARPDEAKNIKGKVLVCIGADDAFVPQAKIEKFIDEMRDGGVDYEVNIYGGAHHAFTNPNADKYHMPNVAYNAAADHRSWEAMKALFEEAFGPNQ